MRLYLKLLLMILAFGAIQHFAPPSAWGGDAWFAFRCQAAMMLGDQALSEQLVDEYYRENRSIDDDVRDSIVAEYYLASAG